MKANGFTLIELVAIIVLLGILSVTATAKYIDLSTDALQAKVDTNGAALKSGVDLAHNKWLVSGASKSIAARNDVQLFGKDPIGQMDFNINGWPSQQDFTTDIALSTDNVNDCLSIWTLLIEGGAQSASTDQSKEFVVAYEGTNICSYKLTENLELGFQYDSTTGKIGELPAPVSPPAAGGGSTNWVFLFMLLFAVANRYR